MLRSPAPDMSSQSRAACGRPCLGFCTRNIQITCGCPCCGDCASNRRSTTSIIQNRDPNMVNNPRASPPHRLSSCIYAPQIAACPSTSRAGTPPRAPIVQPHPSYIPQATVPHQFNYHPISPPRQPDSQPSTTRIPQSTVPGRSNLDNNPLSPPRQQHAHWSSSTPPLQMPEPNSSTSNNLPATHQQNEHRSTTRTSRRTSRVGGSPRVSQLHHRNESRSTSPFVYHYQQQSSASIPAVSTKCLHPVLTYSTLPRLDCDFRFTLSNMGQLGESVPKEVLHEPAVTPPVTEFQLVLPNLTQWPIKVVPTQSTGKGLYYVSIGDVYNAIYSCLRVRLSPEDYKEYAKCYPYPRIIKKKAHVAFYVRCRESPDYQQELNNELRRVDLLMGRTRFRGLAQSETSSKEWVVLCD